MINVRKMKYLLMDLKPYLILWVLMSIACSIMKAHEPYNDSNNCGKTYPIDYIVYTNLFCEVK